MNAQPTEVNTNFIKTFPAENSKKANLEILEVWLKKQPSREAAYVTMGEALIAVRLNLIAREVLDYPPAKNESIIKQVSKTGMKKRKHSEMMEETQSIEPNGSTTGCC